VIEIVAFASRLEVAISFDVAPSTVVKLMQRWRQAGTCEPRPRGGGLRSGPIEAHAAEIDALVAKTVDITLIEIAEHLSTTHGRRFAPSVIWRHLDRHQKTAHASEQARAEVAASRIAHCVACDAV
jgi:transposase